MADPFEESLARLADAIGDARDPWWIIGSAAVQLLGGEPGRIADIDVILSHSDLEHLYHKLPLKTDPDANKPMFSSAMFGRWSEPALDVEFMTGLKVRVEGRWLDVNPRTRRSVTLADCELFVPQVDELVSILHQFGREKDLRRAATLAKD